MNWSNNLFVLWLQIAALALLFFVSAINLVLGLLPYVDNFSSVGGFVSGSLLGFAMLFSPQPRKVAQNKVGLFEYGNKGSIQLKLKQSLDRPILRTVSLLLFGLMWVLPFLRMASCLPLLLACHFLFISDLEKGASSKCRLTGCLLAVLRGINMNQYCKWCRYVDCFPFNRWSCKDRATTCEV